MTAKDDIEINPQKLDTHARSISTHIKALEDVGRYNAAALKATDEKKYTAYEDLPPPSPEDRKRFYGRLQSLIGDCLLYTSPSPRDRTRSRMPSSA